MRNTANLAYPSINKNSNFHDVGLQKCFLIAKNVELAYLPQLKKVVDYGTSQTPSKTNNAEKFVLSIKNMVSMRCKMVVKAELDKLRIIHGPVELGEVETMENIVGEQREELKAALLKSGLELMEDKKAILIERIKNLIVEMIQNADELPNVTYSDYISEKLGYSYTYLANMFSEVKGITIQQYMIMQKIEKVKELILYGELNLSEIAYKLHYSSMAHLSNQFKKVTGLSPSFFKVIKQKRKVNLENI